MLLTKYLIHIQKVKLIETVLLLEGKNSFAFISRKPKLHSIFVAFPIMLALTSNCYLIPTRLFLIQNKELHSEDRIA